MSARLDRAERPDRAERSDRPEKEDPERLSTQFVADKIRPFLATLEGVETTTTATRVGFGDPIEIRVSGNDLSALYSVAEEIRSRGRSVPGVRDLSLSMEMGKPELRATGDRRLIAEPEASHLT